MLVMVVCALLLAGGDRFFGRTRWYHAVGVFAVMGGAFLVGSVVPLACGANGVIDAESSGRTTFYPRRGVAMRVRELIAAEPRRPVDAADVRMVQRGEHLGFALEPGEAIGIEREGFGEDLQGDVAIQRGVARTIDFAHAARAERGEDLVAAETEARRTGHGMSASVDRSYPSFGGDADLSDLDLRKKCVQMTRTRLPAGFGGPSVCSGRQRGGSPMAPACGTLPVAGGDPLPLRSAQRLTS